MTEILGEEVAEVVCRYWDITEAGNFEGRNILHVTLEVEQLAKLFRRDVEATGTLLAEAKARLLAAREQRVRPARDDKMLTAWNALMISAFAKAAAVLADARYRQIALDAVAFVDSRLRRGDRLLSVYKDGVAKLNGYLDDYAFYVAALLDVFELVQDRRHLEGAAQLADAMLAHFWDQEAGGFFFTSDDHEALITRSKPAFDGSIPSGNSVAAGDLLRLYHYTEKVNYLDAAETMLRRLGGPMQSQPFGFANMLCSVDFYMQKPREIVVVAAPGTPDTDTLLQQIRRVYLPNRTLVVVDPARGDQLPSLLQGKTQLGGKPTVYVCHNMACSAPVTTWAELEPLLRR